jgi:hypothetical protein
MNAFQSPIQAIGGRWRGAMETLGGIGAPSDATNSCQLDGAESGDAAAMASKCEWPQCSTCAECEPGVGDPS